MTQKTATVTSTPEVHLPDAPSGGSSTTVGVTSKLLDKQIQNTGANPTATYAAQFLTWTVI